MPSASPSPQQPNLPLPSPPQKVEAVRVNRFYSSKPTQASSTPISPTPSVVQRYRSKRHRKRLIKRCLTGLAYLSRLTLLSGAAFLAVLTGMAIAHFFPDPNPKLPYSEVLVRQFGTAIKIIQTIPPRIAMVGKTLSGDSQSMLPKRIVTTPDLSIPPPPPKSSMSDQQKRLGNELNTVQSELSRLIQQMNTLETRLQSESENTSESSPTDLDVRTTSTSVQVKTYSFAPHQPLLITLPSDALFTDSQATLSPSGPFILESVLPNLLPYKNQVIVINGHTDNSGTPVQNRDISLQQAELIRRHLAKVLQGQYRMVVVGHGANHPLAPNTNSSNRQRNRRIEISAEES